MFKFKRKNKDNKPTVLVPVMHIKREAIEESPDIQKDIDIEKLVDNSIMYYDDKEVAHKDGYVPVNLLLIVRTTYSNRVLCFKDDSKGCIPYIISKDLRMYPHKGVELIMYLCSLAIFNRVNYREGFDDLMLHTEFQVNGIYNPNMGFIAPMFVCTIYLDDNFEDEFMSFCKDKVEWCDISTIKSSQNRNILRGIVDSIVVAKKEDKKDEHDNNA